VFPSLNEGFGLPVLEAMACGAPVACSSTSSLPEVIGEAGVAFDPLDVQSIGDAIARVIDDRDLQLALCERGLQRAAQFTWEHTAQQTLDVYQSILTST
jgi:alpha-1,3-rhamnosyl/mannosyltransferase